MEYIIVKIGNLYDFREYIKILEFKIRYLYLHDSY